ncbi:MAG: glycosyltransferase [Gammaproteobacteria bacterium]|nr:glycosyltransferase [Gammaproteobacteria bacterium]
MSGNDIGGQKPKVLYLVTEDWYFCGHWIGLAEAARAAGYEVVVATRVQELGDRIEASGLRLIPIRMRRRSLSPWREMFAILDLIRIYRRERPDVVHHVAMKPMIYGSIAAAFARVPVVVNAVTGLGFVFTSDRLKARLLRPLIVAAFRLLLVGRGKAVIVQNSDDRGLLRRYLSTEDVRLIRGVGVDLTVFHPGTKRTEQMDSTPLVVLPARMLWDKGVGEFVEAARLLRQRGIRVRMALVGGQDEENPSSIPMECVERWREEGIVECWGYQTSMPDIYRQADIVCLPSYREGLPTVLLEAAASGRPLITTDVPGCREVVENGRNGLLIPARNPAALAEAVEKLAVDRDYAARLGQAGLAEARESFSRDAVNSTTLEIYREVGWE